MKEIARNIIASVISAIIIALMLFVWNDYFFKKDNLAGYWSVKYITDETTHDNFLDLEENYDFLFTQSGDALDGTGEKISEMSSLGFVEYDTAKRTQVTILGTVKYKFFSNSEIDISHFEKGRRRPSSRILKLKVMSNNRIEGTFISTVAQSSGRVELTRILHE